MNEAPTSLTRFIKLVVKTSLLLGIVLAVGGYYFYQKGIVEKAGYIEVATDADSVSDSELIARTLESIPKVDSEDNLTQDEIKSILKNNQVVYTDDESLTEEDRILILKNNTVIESQEN